MSHAGPPPQNGTGNPPVAPARSTGPQEAAVEVAHLDLIRQWPPIQGWVNTNRAALLMRQEIDDAADDWFAAGADPLNEDLLLHRGTRLDMAEALPQALAQGFNERERRYLDACQERRKRELAAEERQRRRELDIRTRWLKFVGIFAALATVLALVSSILYVEQQRQARANLAQALAAQSLSEDGRGQDERATLLALQAYDYDKDGDNRGQVGSALQATAGTPFYSSVVGSQESWVSSLAFSPDGTWLASASSDHSIGLLNVTDPTSAQTFLTGHAYVVNAVAFHPEQRRDLIASGSEDGTVRLWQASTGNQLGPPLLSTGGEVRSVAFDGGEILAAGTCGTRDGLPPDGDKDADKCYGPNAAVRLWSLDAPDRPMMDLPVTANLVCAVAFSVDARWLAVGGCGQRGKQPNGCAQGSGPLLLYDMRDLTKAPVCLNGHQGDIRALAFSPDGKVLASGGADADVRLWNVDAPGKTRILRGHDEGIRSLAFSRAGHVLASGSEDGSVGLWIAAEADLNGPACSAIVPVSSQPTQASQSRCTSLWIATKRPPVVTILGRTTEWVRGVAFSGGSERIFASTHAGGTIRLWDLGQTGRSPDFLYGHAAYIRAIDFNPAATAPQLASTGEDGSLRLWTLGPSGPRQRLVEVVPEQTDLKVNSLSFNCDGTLLATGSEDGTVRLWDPTAEAPTPDQLEDYRDGEVVVAFSPTQDLLVTGSAAATVQIWNPETGDPVGNRLLGPTGPVTAVVFSGDGGMLAAAYGPKAPETEGSIRIWDLRGWSASSCGRGTPISTAEAAAVQPPPVLASIPAPSPVSSLSFHPDGTILAGGDMDGETHLWSLETFQKVHDPLTGHDGDVRAVEFSPDGTMLATGGNDQTVQIWDTDNWDEAPVQVMGIGEWVRAISFGPDSETLAVTGDLGAIRLIVPRSETVAERACERLTRNLSPDEWRQFIGEDNLTPFEWLFQEDITEFREICPGLPSEPENPFVPPGAPPVDADSSSTE